MCAASDECYSVHKPLYQGWMLARSLLLLCPTLIVVLAHCASHKWSWQWQHTKHDTHISSVSFMSLIMLITSHHTDHDWNRWYTLQHNPHGTLSQTGLTYLCFFHDSAWLISAFFSLWLVLLLFPWLALFSRDLAWLLFLLVLGFNSPLLLLLLASFFDPSCLLRLLASSQAVVLAGFHSWGLFLWADTQAPLLCLWLI